VAGFLAIALVAVACIGGDDGNSSTIPEAPSTDLTQRDGGEGGVTVQVTWLTAADFESDGDLAEAAAPYDVGSYLLLRVRMDTHSGDLNRYDLLASSELIADGRAPQAALAWRPLSDGGHHRDGLLVFERPQGAASIELVLKDLAGAPRRVFRWAPPPSSRASFR
jgi:hypothetical protein